MMGFFGSSTVTKCKECGTDLGTVERLERHKEKAHTKHDAKCKACGTVFESFEKLRKHKKKCK